MPRRKTAKRKVADETTTTYSSDISKENAYPAKPWETNSSGSSWKKYLIVIIIVILIALAYRFKNLFIVATVNGQPITRWDYENELNSKYGSSVLENMISEKIILTQAHNQGITVSQADIDNQTKQIENRLNGKISLDNALKAQGLTRDSFRKQLEIQLTIDKMFAKEASVSDKEIADYISQNKDSLPQATDPAIMRADVYNTLRQQKIGDLFDKWFSQMRQKAQVVKY